MSTTTNGPGPILAPTDEVLVGLERAMEQLRSRDRLIEEREETIRQLRAELQAAQQANERLREERDRNRAYFEELAGELFAPPGTDLHQRMASGLTFEQFLKAVGVEVEDAA